jgi:cation diffusion facilitator family transporter
MASNEATRAGRISFTSNVAMACVKLLVGFLGSSYALIADGIESIADTLSSLIVWNGLRVGSREADEDHPYGHGKAEAIATLFAGIGLLVSGVFIASQAIEEIIDPHGPPAFFTVPVLVIIIGVKELLFQFLRKQAKIHDSGALLAEAWHHRSDSLTSLCVLVGLSIAVFAGPRFAPADDVAALLVTVLIFRNGWLIMRPAIDELMDRRITGEKYQRVLQTINQTEGVVAVESLWIRRSGRKYHVDVHLEVDPRISVLDGHKIAHRVKDRLISMDSLNVEFVGTHVEPASQASAEET